MHFDLVMHLPGYFVAYNSQNETIQVFIDIILLSFILICSQLSNGEDGSCTFLEIRQEADK